MSERFVYVISAGPMRQKIGVSWRPESRCETLMTIEKVPLEVHFSAPVDPADAFGIERLAHWQLRDHCLGGEWFGVSPEAAIENVMAAVVAYGAGERVPPPPKLERVYAILPLETWAAVDDWRRQQPKIPTRSGAIRQMVLLAIDAESGTP